MTGWPFGDEQSITGIKLLEFVDWVIASEHTIANGDECLAKDMPIVALPPMQRTAVWRPKQVLDLWDSLMRGLPIGIFYLVERSGGERKVVSLGGQSTLVAGGGFELLDGQQRVRALLVGIQGLSDERCLWVDLGAETAERWPCLRITSKPQPFGYDAATGGKLRLDERRKARARIEPDPERHPIIFLDRNGKSRRAYDLELFDGSVEQDAKPIVQPPTPYGASDQTFKLNELLSAWKNGGIKSVCALTQGASEQAISVLDRSFKNIELAQVALLRIKPDALHDPNQDLLALFERVGAGGTPLSPEERLFSIYKYHVPEIRNAVNTIYQVAGRVLPSTKIVATALRIANANKERPSYYVPSVTEFAEKMLEVPVSELRSNLEYLIPIEMRDCCGQAHPLREIFASVRQALAHSEDAGPFWIPDVLLTELPAGLWHVLVFWASQHVKGAPCANLEFARKEIVRFALFWHLCVWNDDKAASWCFEHIRETEDAPASFPGAPLYRLLSGMDSGDACGSALIPADEFARRLCLPEDSQWRSDKERFGEGGDRNDVGAHWWWYGRKLLSWLQRDYLRRAFPGYAPLTNHEDDLPYDVDHICPYKDWGDWWSVRDRFDTDDPNLKQRMREGRDGVGNGIGNLRLVESSLNRCEQDADVAEKMPFIRSNQPPSLDEIDTMTDWAFAPEHRELWNRVSRPGRIDSIGDFTMT